MWRVTLHAIITHSFTHDKDTGSFINRVCCVVVAGLSLLPAILPVVMSDNDSLFSFSHFLLYEITTGSNSSSRIAVVISLIYSHIYLRWFELKRVLEDRYSNLSLIFLLKVTKRKKKNENKGSNEHSKVQIHIKYRQITRISPSLLLSFFLPSRPLRV